jgi:hypothetical protein
MPDRSSWRRRVLLALACVPAIFAGGCEQWSDWDNVFRKRFWGWMQGDAGSTVAIGGQLLWVFGDSISHGDGTSAQHGTNEKNSRNFTPMFGNFIALHPLSSSPYQAPQVGSADENWGSYTGNVRYFGRDFATSDPVKEITYEATLETVWGGNTQQFFRGTCSGPSVGAQRWPASGIYLSSLGKLG